MCKILIAEYMRKLGSNLEVWSTTNGDETLRWQFYRLFYRTYRKGNTQKTDTIRIITLSKDLATNKNCDYAHSHSHPPQHQPHTSKRTIKNNENQ